METGRPAAAPATPHLEPQVGLWTQLPVGAQLWVLAWARVLGGAMGLSLGHSVPAFPCTPSQNHWGRPQFPGSLVWAPLCSPVSEVPESHCVVRPLLSSIRSQVY